MQEIATYEQQQSYSNSLEQHSDAVHPPDILPNPDVTKVPWWQWVALTVGSAVGIGQVFRFIFSVWFVSSAAY